MNKLIYCLNCGMVINTNPFILTFEHNLSRMKEEQPKQDINLKEEIFYNLIDIEQSEEEYLKFCPICNKWEFHREVL